MNKEINSNGFGYIDLGLPSGTLWATSNVGASKPSDYGLYFQWGNTQGYTADQVGKDKQFNWNNYKWSIDGSSSNFSKYTTTGATLELADDAANANMGGTWHMPTNKQIQELIDNTFHDVEVVNGNKGMRYISKKDTSKSIFVPFAGDCDSGDHNNVGRYGGCWSSSRYSNVDNGYDLNCNDNGDVWLGSYNHYYGFSVRGVIG